MFCGDHRMPFNHDCPGIERYKNRNVRYKKHNVRY
jgi:predicted nucleic acid binding AN1-type Zn finger protein